MARLLQEQSSFARIARCMIDKFLSNIINSLCQSIVPSVNTDMEHKQCTICKAIKDDIEFRMRKTGTRRTECMNCQRVINRYGKDSIRFGEYLKTSNAGKALIAKPYATKRRNSRAFFKTLAWRLKGRNKGQLESASAKELWSLAKKQRLICPYTGLKLNRSNISLDHKTPTSKGGSNLIGNLQFVHYKVNMAKCFMLEDEFLFLCRLISNRCEKIVPVNLDGLKMGQKEANGVNS